MKKIFFLLFILTYTAIFAQSYLYKITGKIISDFDKKALEAATVHLERVKDSTIVSYTISDANGKFNLKGKTYHKKLKMVVSFMGMKTYQKEIEFKQLKDYNSGIIRMYENQNTLNTVVIESKAPITVKKDTLEFNVKSFSAKKNATVEDLLKKLPGVKVDPNGKIKVNGKPVNTVLVNGRPFFGNDPLIATRNLTKNIIDKIQVTNTKTKSEAFTGEKGDEEHKTMNLVIKEENNRGWFGKISAGFGTDKRHEAATLVNKFDNGQTIGILGNQNNISSPSFGSGEVNNMSEGDGVLTSKSMGVNFSDELKKDMEININYFNSNSDALKNIESKKTYQLIEKSYETTLGSNLVSEDTNYNLQSGFSFKIDSTLQIAINPTFSKNKHLQTFKSKQKTFNNVKTLVNKYATSEFSDSKKINFQNDFNLTKKLTKKGAYITVNLNNNLEKNKHKKRNSSSVKIFDSSPSTLNRNQKNEETINRNEINTRSSFKYPIITEKVFLKLGYHYKFDQRNNKQDTYDFNNNSEDFSLFNINQSTDLLYTVIEKKPNFSIGYNYKGKTNLSIWLEYSDRSMTIKDDLRSNSNFSREFNSLNYLSSFSHEFKSKIRLYCTYSFGNRLPLFNQLTPFTDVSNPSYITTGNPNLNLEKYARIYVSINKFNWAKRSNFKLVISTDRNRDVVLRSTSIDKNLIRRSTFINKGNTNNSFVNGSYSKTIKLDSISNIMAEVSLQTRNHKSLFIFNNILINNKVISFDPCLSLNYDYNKILMIAPSYKIYMSKSEFSNRSESNNFIRHRFKLQTRLNLFKSKLEWLNDTRYLYNPNLVGFDKSSWLWNSTLSYLALKDNLTITLKAYNILNQNTNAIRKATDNYIEDRQSSVLQQYFMIGFNWRFNSLGKKRGI